MIILLSHIIVVTLQYELAVGKFPYPPYRNLFEQMKLVLDGPAPQLPDDRNFSEDLRDFVSKWQVIYVFVYNVHLVP